MLNQEKIRWMTKAAIYEKQKGKIDLKRNEYFFSDYVRLHIWQNLVCETLAYALILVLYVMYHIEEILNMVANLEIFTLLKEMLTIYILVMLVYTGAGIIFYAWQYQSSRKRIKAYYRILRHIDKSDEQAAERQEEKA